MEIVWFRNDLRVSDHAALASATRSGKPVMGVYSTFSPRPIGPHRKAFLDQCLSELSAQLLKLDITLKIVNEPVWEALEALDFTGIHFHREAGTEENATAQNVIREARKKGAKTHAFESHNLIHQDDLPFTNCPDLFTTFRKEVEKNLRIRDLIPSGKMPDHPAQARLKHYLWDTKAISTYKETRNGMLKPGDSSHFSPWLAVGALSPREIYWEVRRYEREFGANESTYWMIFELLWRDFFYLQLQKHGAAFFKVGGIQRLDLPWKRDIHLLEAWKAGRTGYPLVDAAMRQLNQTGWMSNRARQNVASFFCKNLGLDWRLGAAYFEEQLTDYDVASNWGNWMYQAGVGNDAREFRLFNLDKQAQQYDGDGAFRKAFVLELRSLSPRDLLNPTPKQREQFGYPKPIVDFNQSASENRRNYERAVRSHT